MFHFFDIAYTLFVGGAWFVYNELYVSDVFWNLVHH